MITRKCIITGKIVPVNNLIRFVLCKNGSIKLQTSKKIWGRGAYCLKDEEVIETLFKKRTLNKSFKRNISTEIYNELRKEVDEYVKKQE